MPERGTCIIAFGDTQSGKSVWVNTHLEEVKNQWFGTENIRSWDGYALNGFDLSSILTEDYRSSTTIVVDHPYTEEHWSTLLAEIPRMKDKGVHVLLVTQADTGRMSRLMLLAEWWMFFRINQASKVFTDPAIREICPLHAYVVNELPHLPTGEFKVVANPKAHRPRDYTFA
ncbi:hypothetical protein [Alicyclobacillus macrosporangiidus]|uniref:Zonular occludens toxin (Zot) n=1 Tax=Alicyclobacillus macrosporangiidus TaxID=392015 RepID=A0A1I7KDA1_9BACL|nr:hypothetical protein [Alicyclobacillus macrosporangiidus]SFU95389.1 hypothetical protein SAMN05421543_11547 [Alicyclobacillus macrosporangiidus]